MTLNDGSTSCDKARTSIADGVLQGGGGATDPEIERHIASCAECQSYQREVNSIWTELHQLPAGAPPGDARRRFDAALARETGTVASQTRWPRIALQAAALLLAAVLGFGAATARGVAPSQDAPAAVEDSTPQFLLLLYDAGSTGPAPSSQAIAAIIAEYSAWARGLSAAGQLVSAEKLADTPATWLGGAVATTTGEQVGGFFLIRARDLAEARRIAETCPHLKHGGRIELRPIEPT